MLIIKLKLSMDTFDIYIAYKAYVLDHTQLRKPKLKTKKLREIILLKLDYIFYQCLDMLLVDWLKDRDAYKSKKSVKERVR